MKKEKESIDWSKFIGTYHRRLCEVIHRAMTDEFDFEVTCTEDGFEIEFESITPGPNHVVKLKLRPPTEFSSDLMYDLECIENRIMDFDGQTEEERRTFEKKLAILAKLSVEDRRLLGI